jgi:hypothetical protein
MKKDQTIRLMLASIGMIGALSCGEQPSTNTMSTLQELGDSAKLEWPGAYPRAAALRGLRSVAVRVYADRSVPGVPGQEQPQRSVRDDVEEAVIQRLAEAGLAITSEESADALLTVSMYLQCQPDGLSCGYHTNLEVQQWVRLARDASISVGAITWRNSYTNGVNRNELLILPSMLRVDAGTLVGGFVEGYRSVNPN